MPRNNHCIQKKHIGKIERLSTYVRRPWHFHPDTRETYYHVANTEFCRHTSPRWTVAAALCRKMSAVVGGALSRDLCRRRRRRRRTGLLHIHLRELSDRSLYYAYSKQWLLSSRLLMTPLDQDLCETPLSLMLTYASLKPTSKDAATYDVTLDDNVHSNCSSCSRDEM